MAFFNYLMREHATLSLFGLFAIILAIFGGLIAVFLNDRLSDYVLMSVAMFVGTLIVVMAYKGISAMKKSP
jgi:Na+/proline symporter